MVALETVVQASVTGEVTVDPLAGASRAIDPEHALDAVTVKWNCADRTSGQPANDVSTHHVTAPSGTRRTSDVSVVVPIRSGVAALERTNSLYATAPATLLHWNVTG